MSTYDFPEITPSTTSGDEPDVFPTLGAEQNYAPDAEKEQETHDRIARKLFAYIRETEDARNRAGIYDTWREIEEGLWTFRSIADVSGLEASDRAVLTEQFEDMLHFPVMLGIMQTALSVIWGMYSVQKPLFEVHGREPSDVVKARLHQIKLDYEVEMNKMMLPIIREAYDAMTYGFGVKRIAYERRIKNKTFSKASEFYDAQSGQIQSTILREKIPSVEYEGNIVKTVNPYDFGSDPSSPAWDIQNGRFVYERKIAHLDDILEDPVYRNKNAVKEGHGAGSGKFGSILSERQGAYRDAEIDPANFRLTDGQVKKNWVEVFRFECVISPAAWFGKESMGRESQKWEFEITHAGAVILARPLDYDHGQFTYTAFAVNPYEKATYPVGLAETIFCLQKEINYLVNSNRTSLRRSLNGWFIYNPAMLDENQLKPARFMKFIRLLQNNPNADPAAALRQVEYRDATAQNLQNIPALTNMMKEVTGITDMIQGLAVPGRRTATEASGLTQYAINRVQFMAGMQALLSLSDTARQMVANNQQFMTQPAWLRLTGEAYQEAMEELLAKGKPIRPDGFMMVQPWEIQGNFDFPTFSPASPNATPAKIESYGRILQELLKIYPALAGTGYAVDLGRAFRRYGRIMGDEEIGDIIVKAETAPNAMDFINQPTAPGMAA